MKKAKKDNSVLFIDASKECVKVTNSNKLTEENIANVINTSARVKPCSCFVFAGIFVFILLLPPPPKGFCEFEVLHKFYLLISKDTYIESAKIYTHCTNLYYLVNAIVYHSIYPLLSQLIFSLSA